MENAYTLYLQGRELLEAGHPAQAAVVLERALQLEPEKASVREALGRAYFNYGQFRQAEEHFKVAVYLHPTDDFAHYCLALCYSRGGRLISAIRHIKIARAMNPEKELYRRVHARLEVRSAHRRRRLAQEKSRVRRPPDGV